jgi:hypothetical protein
MKELKKTIVNQKEAVKFESRYKKIKFTGKSSCFSKLFNQPLEKRKVIRKLEQTQRDIPKATGN